jgi:hypothetical protein
MKKETKDILYMILFALIMGIVVGSAFNKMKEHGIEIQIPAMIV